MDLRLTMALAALVAATAVAQPDTVMTLEQALRQIQHGQGGDAIGVLQRLAEDDDVRAQLALGAALIEGKVVPADRIQGYSWLQIAWLGYPGTSGYTASQGAARDLVQRAERSLSGPELIQGELRGREFRERRTAEWKAAVARARATLLAAREAGRPPARVAEPTARGKSVEVTAGCALDPSRSGCTVFTTTKDFANARCDESPAASPDVIASVARAEPPPLRKRPPVTCSTRYQAQLDRHGYVCSLALMDGCGHAELERTILDSVARWRFVPAMKNGQPVASSHVGGVTVRR
ncbi:MAG TPA: energy transducer TonB [Steroidobacteraceae bacterium]|nr:energy transducer TonB [Steroidobacteraceae bacterium]